MSRVRMGYALALLGILITTGGCAESATAPAAVAGDASLGRVYADSVSPAHRPASGGDMTTLSSGFLTSGGRSEDGSMP